MPKPKPKPSKEKQITLYKLWANCNAFFANHRDDPNFISCETKRIGKTSEFFLQVNANKDFVAKKLPDDLKVVYSKPVI